MNSFTEIDPAIMENMPCVHVNRLENLYPVGQSSESRAVAQLVQNAYTHFLSPNRVSGIIKNPAQRFYSLKTQWQAAVRFLSDTNEICTHETYQKIIGMGEKALPFIYYELKNDPDYWFWALKAITDEDPVPKSDRGNLDEMTQLWLEWLEERLAPAWSEVYCSVVPTGLNLANLIWSCNTSSRYGLGQKRI